MKSPNPYQLAERVHKEVNFSVTYKTDAAQYGMPEHWTVAGKYGDCEDYVLAKRGHLLAAGWPGDKLAICTCVMPSGEGHCVLYVNTDEGGFILDNCQAWPKRPSELPYTWEACLQEGVWRELVGWSSAPA